MVSLVGDQHRQHRALAEGAPKHRDLLAQLGVAPLLCHRIRNLLRVVPVGHGECGHTGWRRRFRGHGQQPRMGRNLGDAAGDVRRQRAKGIAARYNLCASESSRKAPNTRNVDLLSAFHAARKSSTLLNMAVTIIPASAFRKPRRSGLPAAARAYRIAAQAPRTP